jgi:hypothetical protein
MIGALLIDERSPAIRKVCESLAADVLTAGARLSWPEVGPLCGVYTPASELCWRHWVAFRLDWARVGLYQWPEYELVVVLGHVMDRLMAPPHEEVDEPEPDPLLRAVAEDQRLAALDQRLEQGRAARDAERAPKPLSADALATRERWAAWRRERATVA